MGDETTRKGWRRNWRSVMSDEEFASMIRRLQDCPRGRHTPDENGKCLDCREDLVGDGLALSSHVIVAKIVSKDTIGEKPA